LAAGTCAWFTALIGGKCGNSSQSFTGYTKQSSCPACANYTNCTQCTAASNATGCGWYTLAGVTPGCFDASPNFLYSKTSPGFCSGNICAGLANCSSCQAINANYTGACSWFTPASGLSAVVSPKCDIAATGIVDTTLYNAQSTCPPCTDATCAACQADTTTAGTTCQWLAVTALDDSFGQCVTSGTSVTGKSVLTTCPAQCTYYSCSGCVAANGCTWYTYTGTILASTTLDTCDKTSNSFLHPTANTVTAAASCPTCRDSRCYECDSESGCGWYAEVLLGGIFPGTEGCYKVGSSPSIAPTLIAKTDSKCKGNPNSAAIALPGALLALSLFV